MKLEEIANKILVHLKRFEEDEEINKLVEKGGVAIPPYYMPNCYSSGKNVYIIYISFQGEHKLNKKEAETYLKWLDEGYVGKHYTMYKEGKAK